jgi:hypothetical protein
VSAHFVQGQVDPVTIRPDLYRQTADESVRVVALALHIEVKAYPRFADPECFAKSEGILSAKP